jgi:urea transport system substrate-binding protein
MAVDELNAAGGLLGRPLQVVTADGASTPAVFAREAERLITGEGVSVVFGCWSSACRRTIVPVFEREDHLLVYAVSHEGLELSPNVLYTGSVPNQQLVPAVRWAIDKLGKRRPFFVGNDYVYPHTAGAIVRDLLQKEYADDGVTLVGEEYLTRAEPAAEADRIARRVAERKPDVILNTVSGWGLFELYAALRRHGVSAAVSPVLSFRLTPGELVLMNDAPLGDYAVWGYFQDIDTPTNRAFVERFRAYRAARGEPEVRVSDPMASAYTGVHLWAAAVKAAGTPEPAAVRAKLGSVSYDGPEGRVVVDDKTNHVWRQFRIGRVVAGGRFDLVLSNVEPIAPKPYPPSRTPEEWQRFLDRLHAKWNGWEPNGP